MLTFNDTSDNPKYSIYNQHEVLIGYLRFNDEFGEYELDTRTNPYTSYMYSMRHLVEVVNKLKELNHGKNL